MCKKYFFEVGYMDPQVFRCKVLNTLHVQEVFVKVGYMGPQVYKCKVLKCKKYFFEVGYMDTMYLGANY